MTTERAYGFKIMNVTETKSQETDSRAWHQNQRAFYNRRPHRRMWYSREDRFAQDMTNRFAFFSGLNQNDQILEVGCGAGRFTIPLLKKGFSLTAVDISEGMIDRFSKALEGQVELSRKCRVVRSDYEKLDAAGLDAVIGFNVLHHLFDVSEFFKRAKTWLRPKGQIVFLEPNAGNVLHALDSLLDRGWKVEQHKTQCRPELFAEHLKALGFSDIRFEYLGFFPPPLINAVPALASLENRLEKIRFLKKTLPFFMIKGTVV